MFYNTTFCCVKDEAEDIHSLMAAILMVGCQRTQVSLVSNPKEIRELIQHVLTVVIVVLLWLMHRKDEDIKLMNDVIIHEAHRN